MSDLIFRSPPNRSARRRSGAVLTQVNVPQLLRVFPHGIRLYATDAEGQHHSTSNMTDGYLKLLADWAKGVDAGPYGQSFAAH